MTAVKITQLPSATTPLTGSELAPIVQSDVTKKVTINNILSGANVSSSFATASNSTTPRTLAARFGEIVSVKDFGAVGNGVANDTAAFNAAIAHINTTAARTLYIPSGAYLVGALSPITSPGVSVFGDGAYGSELRDTSGTSNLLTFGDGVSTYDGASVSNLYLNTAVTSKTAGAAIFLHKTFQTYIDNVRIANHFQGIRVTNSVMCWINTVNILFPRPLGVGILIDGNSGNDHYISNVFIAGNSLSQPLAGIKIDQTFATWITNCSVLSTGIGLYCSPGAGQIVEHLFLSNNAFDTCANYGMLFQGGGTGIVRRVMSTQDWSATNQLSNILIDPPNGSGFSFQGLRCYNGQQHGIYVLGGEDVRITNSRIEGNGGVTGNYDGIYIAANVNDISVTNTRIGSAEGFSVVQRYGINIQAGTNANYIIDSNDLRGNITGAINAGAVTGPIRITNNIGYNQPSTSAAVTPGASPWTYTAGYRPETLYFTGGTVSDISQNATTIATASPATVELGPQESIVVTYTVVPTVANVTH
jgi:hypothetical protein